MAKLPREPKPAKDKVKVEFQKPSVSFIMLVDIEGGFPSNFKPIKATALRVPVRFTLPAEEAWVKDGKLIETTILGACLIGEQIRKATRDIALAQSGG